MTETELPKVTWDSLTPAQQAYVMEHEQQQHDLGFRAGLEAAARDVCVWCEYVGRDGEGGFRHVAPAVLEGDYYHDVEYTNGDTKIRLCSANRILKRLHAPNKGAQNERSA